MSFSSLSSLQKLVPNLLRDAKLPPAQELVLLALFVAYIVLPVKMPAQIAISLGSPLGLLAILSVALFLFMYTHPVLGIVYLFVAYEMITRSGMPPLDVRDIGAQYAPIYTPQPVREVPRESPLLISQEPTLEETVIGNMEPIQTSTFFETSFKPMSENIHSAYAV